MFDAAAFIFFPVSICVWLMLCGLTLLVFTRKRTLGVKLVATAATVLLVGSNPWLSDRLNSFLERQYPEFDIDGYRARVPESVPAEYIVVLAAGLNHAGGIPATSALGSAGLMRLVEGMRIQNAVAGSTVILSGGNEEGKSEAAAMAELAIALGIQKSQFVMEPNSLTTYEQALNVKAIVGTAPVIVVTSAGHMPRAMALFRGVGLDPFAAPTDHASEGWDFRAGAGLIPSAGALSKTSRVFYEGFAWLKAWTLGRL